MDRSRRDGRMPRISAFGRSMSHGCRRGSAFEKGRAPRFRYTASAVILVLVVLVAGVAVSSEAPASASPGHQARQVPQTTYKGTGEYPPSGVAVQTDVDTATCDGMKIGSKCEPGFAPEGFVNVVVVGGTIRNAGGTRATPDIYNDYSDVALWSCTGSGTCTSPLEALLQKDVGAGKLALISQPNNFGSGCPSTDYSLTPACPPPTTATLAALSELAPELKWQNSPAALYQPWSIIYTPTCSNCQVSLNEDQTLGRPAGGSDEPAGDLSGLFEANQYLNLVYTTADFVPFDTLVSKSGTDEMVFDGKVVGKTTISPGQAGFMVAVLNRADLSLDSYNSYTTNGNANLQVDLLAQALMGALLAHAASNDDLVAIQSFGRPAPIPAVDSCTSGECGMVGESSCTGVPDCYPYDPDWARLGEEIHAIGGTMAKFDALNDNLTLSLDKAFNCSTSVTPMSGCQSAIAAAGDEYGPTKVCGGYAFVGGAGVPNSYEVFGSKVEHVQGLCPNIKGSPAMVQGVLTRDPSDGLFEPFLASALAGGTGSTSGLDTSLFTEAYPAPGKAGASFPTYTGGQETAFTKLVGAINAHGGGRVTSNLRSSYWQDTIPGDWKTNIGYMKSFDCATSKLPASDDCAAIQKQLITEMEDVETVYSVFESSDSVLNQAALWGVLNSGPETTLTTLQNELIQETQVAASHSTLLEVLSILSSVFAAGASVASVIGPEGAAVGAGLGVVSAALGIAGTIVSADSQSSGSSFEGQINTTAGNLQTTLDSAFDSMKSTILTVGEMFTTNLGRLSFMAKLISSGAFTHSSAVDLEDASTGIQQAMIQTIYSQLVPIVWGVGVGYDATNLNAVPGTVTVGNPLLDALPGGCWHGKGIDEGAFGTAEMPTSGPVLDSPYDPSPNGTPPAATLTTLQPEASFFLAQANGNVCGSTSSTDNFVDRLRTLRAVRRHHANPRRWEDTECRILLRRIPRERFDQLLRQGQRERVQDSLRR